MKRSPRLVLILGVLLAVVAFGSVFVLVNQRPQATAAGPASLPTVYARVAIPLGTVITADMIEARDQSVTVRAADAFGDVGQVVGRTVRTDVAAQALLAPSMFLAGAGGGQDVAHLLDPGLRAIAVAVDQNTGVGTLINVGDRVDLVVGFTGQEKVPTVNVDESTDAVSTVTGLNTTTVKAVLQNMQVIGTLSPPAPKASGEASEDTTTATFTGQQELVILAVTIQQAEIIKFAQMDGQITLVLRSPKDYLDDEGTATQPKPDLTSGTILKTLIDEYGVLPPQLIPAPVVVATR